MELNYRELDFTRLLVGSRSAFQEVEMRADAQLAKYAKLTVEDRFEGFGRIGYHPHGLYVPTDEEMRRHLRSRLSEIGDRLDSEEQIREYLKLQSWTGQEWADQEVEGSWTGQMAVAISAARFRLVAWGRRGGKTFHAAREALAVGIMKPMAVIWVCAPTMKLVGRCFDMIVRLAQNLGLEIITKRDNTQEKLLVIGNGSRFEGVSLEEGAESAGTGADFAVIDEAAKVEDERVWTRDILPVLTDKDGDALLISSWEGEDNFFFDTAESAEKSGDEDWAVFKGATWENFFQFPQGRRSKKISTMEKRMDPVEFLEEFGGIPARSKDRVYTVFKDRVHLGHWPFNPDHPVKLSVDPSSGGDPYSAIVVQDYGDSIVQIDEFYESGIPMEEIAPILDKRIWRPNVTDMVVDSNWPHEVVRWGMAGWPAYPVPEKPDVRERVPIHRRWLRDPVRFRAFYLSKAHLVMIDMGLDPQHVDYTDLDPEVQRSIAIQVEEMLGDNNLTESDISTLRDCARIRIDRSCVNTTKEHKKYKYKKGTELFAKGWDHTMDCWGYYLWTFHRTDDQSEYRPGQMSYFRLPLEGEGPPVNSFGGLPLERVAGEGFLSHLRERYDPAPSGDVRWLRQYR